MRPHGGCVGTVAGGMRPCPHRPRWMVTSKAQVEGALVCRYHMIDVVERVTSGGFPAMVNQIGQ